MRTTTDDSGAGRTEDKNRSREAEAAAFKELRRTGDAALRDRLAEEYLWLARHAARRFGGRGQNAEDLLQVASLALVKAIDRFDPAHGVRFATYAMPTMIGELRRHFRDATWAMRVPRRLKDLHVELRTAREDLTHLLGRTPTVDELADVCNTAAEEILEAIEAGASYTASSLEQPAGQEGTEEAAWEPGECEAQLEAAPIDVTVRAALATLPPRDREVVFLRFYEDLTQSEIAERVGVSQVHVSRILRSALNELHDHLDDDTIALTA